MRIHPWFTVYSEYLALTANKKQKRYFSALIIVKSGPVFHMLEMFF